jgi:hypothetical protein
MRDIRALAARHIAQRYIAALTALERKQAWRTVQQSRIEFRSITEEINTRVQVLRNTSFLLPSAQRKSTAGSSCHAKSQRTVRSPARLGAAVGAADGAHCVAPVAALKTTNCRRSFSEFNARRPGNSAWAFGKSSDRGRAADGSRDAAASVSVPVPRPVPLFGKVSNCGTVQAI